MGGSAGIVMLLGMLRIKFTALIIGSNGVGLLAGFTAIQGFISTIAGIGLQSSAVREITTAISQGDDQSFGRIILSLRRICFLSGLLGMIIIMALSPWISSLTFNSEEYILDIAALGIVVLLANMTNAYQAILQGMRHISEMAKANIYGSIIATVSSIGFLYFLGIRGIIPSLIGISAINFTIIWFILRGLSLPQVRLTWMQTYREASTMIKLGLVYMWNGLMLSAVSYLTITLISREADFHAVGLYSAAFGLSGLFVNFVLGAMGADYYPRLISERNNKEALNRLANEQIEIALLLATPGLLATLSLGSWALEIFYSQEFLAATELLQWFVLGCLCRVISWPLGFIIMALGEKRWYLLTETIFNIIHLTLILLGLKLFGVEGVAIAFLLSSFLYIVSVYLVCNHLTGFNWSIPCRHLALRTILIFIITYLLCRNLKNWQATFFGIFITLTISIICLQEIINRVEIGNRFLTIIFKIPGIKLLFKK